MKIKKYYFVIVAAATAALCGHVLADANSPELYKRPVKSGVVEPGLLGIEKLYVVIDDEYALQQGESVIWDPLGQKVEQRIKDVGIEIATASERGRTVKPSNISELRININMYELVNSNQKVFYVQTSLATEVYSMINPMQFYRTNVWSVGSTVKPISLQSAPDEVFKLTMEQVDLFIQAYAAANLRYGQIIKAKTGDADSISAVKESGKDESKPAEAQQAENEYVASNKAKVFHRPGCHWAKRIKPENVIAYSSRDEAVKAHKKPCKRCKP